MMILVADELLCCWYHNPSWWTVKRKGKFLQSAVSQEPGTTAQQSWQECRVGSTRKEPSQTSKLFHRFRSRCEACCWTWRGGCGWRGTSTSTKENIPETPSTGNRTHPAHQCIPSWTYKLSSTRSKSAPDNHSIRASTDSDGSSLSCSQQDPWDSRTHIVSIFIFSGTVHALLHTCIRCSTLSLQTHLHK